MIYLLATFLFLADSLPAGVGSSRNISSSGVCDFFSDGNGYLEDSVSASYTYGAARHVGMQRLDGDWMSAAYPVYAAWFERVYWACRGPRNNWSRSEWGGTTLPDINWRLGVDSTWKFYHCWTNLWPDTSNPNVLVASNTIRLVEWKQLQDAEEAVAEFIDNREDGKPIMTRGRYWDDGYLAGQSYRRMWWGSKYLPCANAFTSSGWHTSGTWVDHQKPSSAVILFADLMPSQTSMHTEDWNASYDKPGTILVNEFARTDGDIAELSSGLTTSGTIERVLAEVYSTTNVYYYTDYTDKLKRIRPDAYYGWSSEVETNAWFCSRPAAASRALAIMDRTYELPVKTNIAHTAKEYVYGGHSYLRGTTREVWLTAGPARLADNQTFVVDLSQRDEDVAISFPTNYNASENTKSVTTNIVMCSGYDYAYCSGLGCEEESARFSAKPTYSTGSWTSVAVIPSGLTSPTYIPYVRAFVSFGIQLIQPMGYTIKISAGTATNVVYTEVFPYNYYYFTDIAEDIQTVIPTYHSYRYELSDAFSSATIGSMWRYAGPSALAFSNGKVDTADAILFAGILGAYDESSPCSSQIAWWAGSGKSFKSTNGSLGVYEYSSESGWKEEIADGFSSIRSQVIDMLSTYYTQNPAYPSDFMFESVGSPLGLYEFSEPFAILNMHDRTVVVKPSYKTSIEMGEGDSLYIQFKSDGTFDTFAIGDPSTGLMAVSLSFVVSIDGLGVDLESNEVEVQYSELDPEKIPNSRSAAADSKSAVLLRTDWDWDILKLDDD